MKLSEIKLEQITEEEHRGLCHFWFKRPEERRYSNPARIVEPVTANDCRGLIVDFIVQDFAYRATVYDNGWKRFYANKIRLKHIDKMINIMERDKSHTGILEFHYLTPNGAKTKIKFVERYGVLVGHEMTIDSSHFQWFDWKQQPTYDKKHCHALWAPARK